MSPPTAVSAQTLRISCIPTQPREFRNYTEVIAQHDGWDLVDVYADEGLTGTRVDKRDDFNRMMRDCRKGKIDCILVKSVARFARNTKECLASLRELSGMGVTVRFEKENIDTGTLTTELMVSVSQALSPSRSPYPSRQTSV